MWGKLSRTDICNKLLNNENFSFARYGDGEWSCVFGKRGGNCDGHPYNADLGLALSLCYYMGIQPKALRDMGREIMDWQESMQTMIEWCDADVLHNASTQGLLHEFTKALGTRRCVFVGPERLSPIATKLSAPHVIVPLQNVWRWYRQIYGDILDQIDKDVVILYSMSMATKPMIHRIHEEYGDTVTQVDCGSVWDVYAGFPTRRYHQDIIRKGYTI
jgi:hypothetical protein